MTMTAREAFARGTETFNAHDVDGFAAVLADDVTFAAPGGLTAAYPRSAGASSRSRWRVRKRITLDQVPSRNSHSSSEPSCEDHAAAAR